MNEDATETKVTEGSDKTSLPVWFWVISIVALLWYLMDMPAVFAGENDDKGIGVNLPQFRGQ